MSVAARRSQSAGPRALVFRLVPALGGLLALAACTGPVSYGGVMGNGSISGSGAEATEERSIPAFDAVRVNGAMEVTITIGDRQRVAVTADDNVIPVISTTVQDGQLVIAATRSYEPRTPVVVAVTVPALTSIETTGSGDVTAQGLQAAELRIQAQGSGAVTATGTAGRVTVTATGSGGIRLADLVVRVMEIRATGSSTLDVHITDALTGTLMGTGDLIYRGTPQLAVRALGTGQVRPG